MKGNTTVTTDTSALKNRLAKNQKKLKSYLQKNKIEAYRLYNKDIPEYPYLIDIYGSEAVIYEQGKKLGEEDQTKRELHQNDIEKALEEVLGIPAPKQHFKIREKQKGNEQYRPLEPGSHDFFPVNEPPFKFLVNLERYLDTGLFLDHRPLRQHIYANSNGKTVLNLFCYTGSISVAAALGGGTVTSIDMSNTYLQWAYENFLLNNIDPKKHVFYQADVLKELNVRKENKRTFRYDHSRSAKLFQFKKDGRRPGCRKRSSDSYQRLHGPSRSRRDPLFFNQQEKIRTPRHYSKNIQGERNLQLDYSSGFSPDKHPPLLPDRA